MNYLDLWEIILTALEGRLFEALYAGPPNGPSRWNSACAVIVSRCLSPVCMAFLVNKYLKLNAVFKTNRTQLKQEFTESYQKHFFIALSWHLRVNPIFPWSLRLSGPSFKSEALQAKQEKTNGIIWIIHLKYLKRLLSDSKTSHSTPSKGLFQHTCIHTMTIEWYYEEYKTRY